MDGIQAFGESNPSTNQIVDRRLGPDTLRSEPPYEHPSMDSQSRKDLADVKLRLLKLMAE